MSASAGEKHVHAVVVGSGFGGSVAAFRLAEAGHSVVLLERGKRYPPGSFARTPAETGRSFWDPSEGLLGLFDIWSFEGLDAVVSSGLGGGSLIYANVLLRKDERWFVSESPVPGGGYENWPITREKLDRHYGTVEQMLDATPYPYENTRKTMAMRDSAQRLSQTRPHLSWQLPPLAVTFAPAKDEPVSPGATMAPGPYPNIHGMPRRTCRLCGECDIGCNDGAKNTLDHTYLSAAAHHGADIRTLSEVRSLSPLDGGGYEVRYVVHDPANEGRRTATGRLPLHVITCDRLILGAGTFGTTYLLLRNRAALPGLSRTLGTRFSGNGDLLTFLFNARHPDGSPRQLDGSRGPVITSAIRVDDEVDGGTGPGYYIEDAGYPMFAAWLAENLQLSGSLRRAAQFAAARMRARIYGSAESRISQSMSALLGPGNFSDSSLPLLGMGRDVPDGVMRLRRGRLSVGWTTATSKQYFSRVRDTMRAIAGELGADYLDNPLWRWKRTITVHPLGGAPMGRHPGEGTCDEFGEVFGFPGLYVLDGALMPGPVGANPSLTIAATAEYACERMLATPVRGRKHVDHPADRAGAVSVPKKKSLGKKTSLAFTEEMKGFVELGEADPAIASNLGRLRDQRLMFRLTIWIDDVARFVADAEHPGRAEGYVDCDLLGGRLKVVRGWFNLFTQEGDPTRRLMLYRLHLLDHGGTALTFAGHKDVRDDPGFDVWRDTSTLYFRIFAGHLSSGDDRDAATMGSGVITIHLPDFAQQMASFRVHGPHPAQALQAFGRLFLGELWEVYGAAMMRGVSV